MHVKKKVCPHIRRQAVPESGCRQAKSSLSVDVNCQHRLTSCHSVSDYQDALITGTAHKLGDAAAVYEFHPADTKITKFSKSR